jgi:hypothetical protein
MSSSSSPSKCPFQSLVGKLWGAASTLSTEAAPAGGGGCPLGFGRPAGASASSKCPLGFGSSSNAPQQQQQQQGELLLLPTMTLAELREDGPGKGLVSVKGLVFDVSARAEEMRPLLGHDCSRFFALGGGGEAGSGAGGAEAAATMLDHGLEGLSYEQVVRLERVLEAFLQSFTPPVALLAEADRRALFGAASMVGPPTGAEAGAGVWAGDEAAAERGLRLHELIEQGAGAVAVEALLAETGTGSANYPCPRTGLRPLHKALVEGGDDEEALKEVVRLLVAQGADRKAPAALYDGDTPVQLARRFKRGPEVEALLQQQEEEGEQGGS